MPLDGYDRVMNFTAGKIAEGTVSKLHADVDADAETVEAITDPTAQAAGKHMRHIMLNEDSARSTSNLHASLPLELNSQELAGGVMDSTGDMCCSPEKRASK